jgi:uncharacterized protein
LISLLTLDASHWGVLLLSALVIGFSKSGVPGTGIVAVPLLAFVFGGRLSVGTAIPMLIFADLFAVHLYWKSTSWKDLLSLLPGVIVGFILGAIGLFYLVPLKGSKDPLNVAIGVIVLLMLLTTLLRGKLGDKMVPTSPTGVKVTGALAGFTTMVSNAAGPVMQIYLVATKMPKEAMLGTTSVYFFCVNTAKIPFYLALTLLRPNDPMWTIQSVATAVSTFPLILLGSWIGKSTQEHIPEKLFKNIVLVFAALGSLKLILF